MSLILAAVHLWLSHLIDKLFGTKPPAVPGRNFVGGNITQDEYQFWKGSGI